MKASTVVFLILSLTVVARPPTMYVKGMDVEAGTGALDNDVAEVEAGMSLDDVEAGMSRVSLGVSLGAPPLYAPLYERETLVYERETPPPRAPRAQKPPGEEYTDADTEDTRAHTEDTRDTHTEDTRDTHTEDRDTHAEAEEQARAYDLAYARCYTHTHTEDMRDSYTHTHTEDMRDTHTEDMRDTHAGSEEHTHAGSEEHTHAGSEEQARAYDLAYARCYGLHAKLAYAQVDELYGLDELDASLADTKLSQLQADLCDYGQDVPLGAGVEALGTFRAGVEALGSLGAQLAEQLHEAGTPGFVPLEDDERESQTAQMDTSQIAAPSYFGKRGIKSDMITVTALPLAIGFTVVFLSLFTSHLWRCRQQQAPASTKELDGIIAK